MQHDLFEEARKKGTDAEYQTWVRRWPSCLSGAYTEYVNGEGMNVYAHVRRVSSGAGMAEKPPYSGIPLTDAEHQMQHQRGEGVFAPPEWYDAQARNYLYMWIHGAKPPSSDDFKAHWKKDYIIEYPGQILALWLLLKKHFSKENAKPVKCTLQRHVKRRSHAQLKYRWGPVYDQVLEYYEGHMDKLIYDTLEAINFGVTKDFINEMFKLRFTQGKSTSESTIDDMEFIANIRDHMMKYELFIPEPDESLTEHPAG